MTTSKTTPRNVDDYVERFPTNVQRLLTQVRRTISKAAPKAEEVISYGIPGFKLGGNLVWFAAFKNHVGFYPGSSAIATFAKELSAYKAAKGRSNFRWTSHCPWLL